MFKPGDRVVCVDDDNGVYANIKKGNIYTIADYDRVYVRVEHSPHWYSAHKFCLAADLEPSAIMPSNPKQHYGDTKVPLHLFPSTAIALGAMALLEGREKYGENNFRAAPVEAMTYVRACISHMMAWMEGRDIDPDSGIDELGKALACVAILIDAKYAGTLIDNRKYPGGYQKLIAELEPHVERIRKQHEGKNPKHYTIGDKI